MLPLYFVIEILQYLLQQQHPPRKKECKYSYSMQSYFHLQVFFSCYLCSCRIKDAFNIYSLSLNSISAHSSMTYSIVYRHNMMRWLTLPLLVLLCSVMICYAPSPSGVHHYEISKNKNTTKLTNPADSR